MGFVQPTPIQEQSIPYLLNNDKSDFIGLAQTGTGKTAAFGLPLIELVDGDNPQTQALIMAPTRELGQQTAKQLEEFSKHYKKINIEVVYGGAAITNQIRALKKSTQIVVATPGRLLDLIRRKAIKLENVKHVVLDEADEMLNMGFKEDIDSILSNIKGDYSTWLFSATMPKEIRKIVKKYMSDPLEVAIKSDEKSNADISHQYVVTKVSDKLAVIRRFLDTQPDMRAILFCRTKRETQQIADELAAQGYQTEALHGDLSQGQRDSAMARFKRSNKQLLVATDVAARGIDISELTHVLHHKLPDQLESYTHRSGRTGRAGNKGISIAFINNREKGKIKDLEKSLKITFENAVVPSLQELKDLRLQKWVNEIKALRISEDAETTYLGLAQQFEDFSKEDILKGLLSQELKQLKQDDVGDLNDKSKATYTPSGNRFFINIGKEDGFTKNDLVELIAQVGQTKSKNIDNLVLQDRRAFFDLNISNSKDFGNYFEGLELENGHAIRVNPETGKSDDSKPHRRKRGDGAKRGNFPKSNRKNKSSVQKSRKGRGRR